MKLSGGRMLGWGFCVKYFMVTFGLQWGFFGYMFAAYLKKRGVAPRPLSNGGWGLA